jgi:hypothetical protein
MLCLTDARHDAGCCALRLRWRVFEWLGDSLSGGGSPVQFTIDCFLIAL